MHMLFDDTNSLVENDAQDEEYKLGLARKELLLTHEEGKCPEDGSSSGADLLEGGQGLNQIGGSVPELSLEQNQPNSPQTGSETSSRIVSEPVSPIIPARVESVSMGPLTPRPWKHQRSHPLIKFYRTLIQECKLDPNLKISMLSMLFSLILSQKMLMKSL